VISQEWIQIPNTDGNSFSFLNVNTNQLMAINATTAQANTVFNWVGVDFTYSSFTLGLQDGNGFYTLNSLSSASQSLYSWGGFCYEGCQI